MLGYDKVNVSQGIDTNKTDGVRECTICYYWYFLKISFRFQTRVCDDCHDTTQKSMNGFDGTAIVTVKGHDDRMEFWFMTKTRLWIE